MSDLVETLLSGPRGRRLCLECAMSASPEIRTTVFRIAHGSGSGHSVLLRSSANGSTGRDLPVVGPEDLAAMIEALPADAVGSDAIRSALCMSVDTAWYWQEPDEQDAIASLPVIRSVLLWVAELVLSSPTAAAWTNHRESTLWAVDWGSDPARPLPTGAAAVLSEWTTARRADEHAARERPSDPQASWSGTWWSLPLRLLRTQSKVEDLLELVEDSIGLDTATVIPVDGDGRTLEIESEKDWAELCRTYPAEVTASRRHDWYRVTGWQGRWLIPDWPRVATAWDAVHLTTLGYLSSATRLITVDGDYGSVIGGWAPDSTIWLTDSAHESAGPRQQWTRPRGEDRWKQSST